ncbi:MAG: fumarylacetoacetase [Vulcanimicrobiota bacterium]
MNIDATHDPNLTSWVEPAQATDFPIQNLPFCRFLHEGKARLGVAIEDQILDLYELASAGLVEAPGLLTGSLNEFAASGQRQALRLRLSQLLRADNPELRDHSALRAKALRPQQGMKYLCPFEIGDYTDFYASVHHATNVGSMFRPDNPLLPNWKYVPVAYHGRASTVVPSGTPVRRPSGQLQAGDAAPVREPSKLMDYELEVGVYVGKPNPMGETVAIGQAEDHLFGLCLVNDWSARDIQRWEYQPLGPFLAKSFCTTVSPFVVTMEALAPFRCPAFERPEGDPAPLPYLADPQDQARGGVDITLEVLLRSAQMAERNLEPMRLSQGSFRHMYWTVAQMVTHHASNGCALNPGDLLASGTVSGPEPGSRGCLLELTWDGPDQPRKQLELPTGEKRTFLLDGDEVILRGRCQREGYRSIGFGVCAGVVEPALVPSHA